MSVSVEINTKKQVEPKQIFDKLVEHGECIMVVSDNFPSLKFGTINKSLRGIEINREDYGYEVRAFSCSSHADYKLFAVAIDVLMKLTESCSVTIYDEPVINPYESFDQNWIDTQLESSRNVICAMVKYSGTAVVMYGLFFPFCIGLKILQEFNINTKMPSKDSFETCLLGYLIDMQWKLKDERTTYSRLAIQNKNDKNDRPLGVSLITIQDNQLNDFGVITHNDLMGFMDTDRNETAIIHFEDLWKTVRTDNLFRIDEYQYWKKGDLSVVDVRNMIKIAKRFQPEDLFYRPTYPGNGFDENQNTFVLMWNPAVSSVTEDDFAENMMEMFEGWFNWSVFEWEKAKMGDRFYLVRVGEGKGNGIVMAGVFGSQPYQSEDWSEKERVVYYMDLNPNIIISPAISPIMSTKELEKAVPDFQWQGGHSGIMLNQTQAKKLESVFSICLSKIEKEKDNNILIRHKV